VTLILNVFCYVKEGDAFLITHKKPVSRRARAAAPAGLQLVQARAGAAALPPVAGPAGALAAPDGCLPLLPPPAPQGFEFGIRVSSRLDRYTDTYVLCMSSADKLQRG
jgi:hypothetical protein